MNSCKAYCEFKYYNEFDSSSLLGQIQARIDPSTTTLNKEFQLIFDKFINTISHSRWNTEVYKQTSQLLESVFVSYENQIEIDETMFNYFLMGCNSFFQIYDIISDYKNFNLKQEIKTKLYRLPIYTALIESCLSNFLRIIAILTGKSKGKDYSKQNSLGQLIDVIKSNGYTEIANYVDVNIRNAINHGKILTKKTPIDKICFFYMEKNKSKSKEMDIFEFDRIIEDAFDTVSATLLSIVVQMNKHIELIKVDDSKKEYASFSLLAMRLSLPGIYCQSISDIENLKQLNIEIEIENADNSYIAQISIMMAILIYDIHSDYERYMFSFRNPRMMNGWVRFKNKEISDMINCIRQLDEVFLEVKNRGDFIIFSQSTENVDLKEIQYFCFPEYSCKEFQINCVDDCSTENRKRLNASLYVRETIKKEEILNIIKKAIEWLKNVKNPPSPVIRQKHGDIPADSIYIKVYRSDDRKAKALHSTNKNFVCFVDYNIDGVTTLKDGGIITSIWEKFYHEKVDNMLIAWRESKYITRRVNKIGRNELCPCGSRKKFKRCCLGKGIYD